MINFVSNHAELSIIIHKSLFLSFCLCQQFFLKLKISVFGSTVSSVKSESLQVVWMKDGKRVSTSRRVALRFTEDGYCSLDISNVTSTDTGIYLVSFHDKL